MPDRYRQTCFPVMQHRGQVAEQTLCHCFQTDTAITECKGPSWRGFLVWNSITKDKSPCFGSLVAASYIVVRYVLKIKHQAAPPKKRQIRPPRLQLLFVTTRRKTAINAKRRPRITGFGQMYLFRHQKNPNSIAISSDVLNVPVTKGRGSADSGVHKLVLEPQNKSRPHYQRPPITEAPRPTRDGPAPV